MICLVSEKPQLRGQWEEKVAWEPVGVGSGGGGVARRVGEPTGASSELSEEIAQL